MLWYAHDNVESCQWWSVKIFDIGGEFDDEDGIGGESWWLCIGLSRYARSQLGSDFGKDSIVTGGEVFRCVLDASSRGNAEEAAVWSGMLTARNRRNIHEVQTTDGGRLLAAVSPLTPFAALWQGLVPGAWNLVLPMRCREVRAAPVSTWKANCVIDSVLGDIPLPWPRTPGLDRYARRRSRSRVP